MIIELPLKYHATQSTKSKVNEVTKHGRLNLRLNKMVHDTFWERRASKKKQTLIEQCLKRENKKLVDSIFVELLYLSNSTSTFNFTDKPMLE